MGTDRRLVLHLYFSDLAARAAAADVFSLFPDRGYRVFADVDSGLLYRVNGSWASLAEDAGTEIAQGRAFWGIDYAYVGSVAHDSVAVLVDDDGRIDGDAAKILGLRPVLSEIEDRIRPDRKVVPLFPRR